LTKACQETGRWAAKTAAGLAAGGLGAWVRYSPFGQAVTAARTFLDNLRRRLRAASLVPLVLPVGLVAAGRVGGQFARHFAVGAVDVQVVGEHQDAGPQATAG
jgi:hypothetical protein